jgi:hypothetical protein
MQNENGPLEGGCYSIGSGGRIGLCRPGALASTRTCVAARLAGSKLVHLTIPSSSTPAFSHLRIGRTIRLSSIRRSRKRTSHS